jgi:hypothetical protein
MKTPSKSLLSIDTLVLAAAGIWGIIVIISLLG